MGSSCHSVHNRDLCWDSLSSSVLPDREVKALHVKCSNANRGCEWVGTVGTLEKHVATSCGFIQVPCPKQCKDDNDGVKCFMQKHHLLKHCGSRKM